VCLLEAGLACCAPAASFRRRAAEAQNHANIVRSTLADAASTTLQPVDDGGVIVKSETERVI